MHEDKPLLSAFPLPLLTTALSLLFCLTLPICSSPSIGNEKILEGCSWIETFAASSAYSSSSIVNYLPPHTHSHNPLSKFDNVIISREGNKMGKTE